MRTAALSFLSVLMILPSSLNAMCPETESHTVKGEIIGCERPTQQLREAAGQEHEREGKVAYPDREEFIEMVLATNSSGVLLTVRISEERVIQWRWSRDGHMRGKKEIESKNAPR